MKVVAWVALAVSLAGSMLAMSAYWRVRSAPAAPPADDIEALKARIAGLESARAAAPAPPSEPGSPPAPGGELAELRRRIELLEQRQGPGQFQPPESGRPVRGNPAQIDMQKKRLLDAAQPERNRVQALGVLRSQRANKTDDVVDAGLALLAQSKEPAMRSMILRGLQGAENARVVAPVLSILGADPDERARQEAAGVLGEYVDQPGVKAALEQAAATDASERVRTRADSALNPPARQK